MRSLCSALGRRCLTPFGVIALLMLVVVGCAGRGDISGKVTYKGKVRRIGGTFLPKRSSIETLLNNETRVLEAEVEVLDPNPTDRPPLRVGQRVRVDLGQ